MDLNQALDKLRIQVLIKEGKAFLGCLLCNYNFYWDESIETACVNTSEFKWNPKWFESLNRQEREFVLLHEIWHIALLHGLRLGGRDPERWNAACDFRINSNLIAEKGTMPKGGLYNPKYNDPSWTEEAIYDDLPESFNSPQSWGTKELTDDPGQVTQVQSAVVMVQQMGQDAGNASAILEQFLKPKLNWRQLLRKYLLDYLDPEWSWKRPNRRHSDIYLPALIPGEGRLTRIAVFLDTSGSIGEEQYQRFVSEVKFIQENLCPQFLDVVQFDTVLQEVKTYTESQRFSKVNLKGFGGTSYTKVRDYILKTKPVLSIIFTDLYATPMKTVGKLPVYWVVHSNPTENAPFGKTFHVE